MKTVPVTPLSAAAFAPFGGVVSAGLGAGAAANQGTAVRFDRCVQLANSRPGATPNLAVFRSACRSLPFAVTLLERHPFSTQTFIPMVCHRFLVIVAPTIQGGAGDGEPDLDRVIAFVCGPGQGITYNPGVWHHPIIAIDGDADFAMLAWEDGSAGDCVEHHLSSLMTVVDAPTSDPTKAPATNGR